jgi:uncharacterized MAPEG superfamily protein
MTTPLWALLAFAIWTVLLLLGTVGVYRWARILTGRVAISAFRADRVEGDDWYRRAMRAHANCVENLPVFGAIVLAVHASGIVSPTADRLAVVAVVARVAQSLVHVGLAQTDAVTSVRFVFFFAQIVCFLGLAGIVIAGAS